MKRLFFMLILGFFWLGTGRVDATSFGDAIREVDNGRVLVWNRCIYTVKLKDRNAGPVYKVGDSRGNGFFIDNQYDRKSGVHLVLTAKHVVTCAKTDDLPENFYGDDLAKDAVDSIIVTQSMYIIFRGVTYAVNLGDFNVNRSDVDLAILEAVLPESENHYHNMFLPESAQIDLGSELVIRGFMPFDAAGGDYLYEKGIRGWLTRLQITHIEHITEDGLLMQLSSFVYPGQSGSAVYLYKSGKLYLAGVLVMAAFNDSGAIDTSWATLLKKEYFIPNKKP